MTSRAPIPERRATLLGVLAVAALLAPPAHAATLQYESVLRGRTLVEGLGFEGILTVFDETPRMYRHLGEPRVVPEYPLWYFYDQGTFKLIVRAIYRDGRFLVRSIKYADDRERRVTTNQGIKLGDPLQKVLETHGEAARIEDGDFRYPRHGVTFHIGEQSTVVGITIYRPERGDSGPTPPHGPGPTPPVEPTRPAPPIVKKAVAPLEEAFAAIGVSTPVPETWRVTRKTRGEYVLSSPYGRAQLTLKAGTGPQADLAARIAAFERVTRGNQIPEPTRTPPPGRLLRMNAGWGYFGLYLGPQQQPTWLIALRDDSHWVLAVLSVSSVRGLDPHFQRQLLTMLERLTLRPIAPASKP